MISLVVPTRNRAYTLALVAESYFRQELVSEILFIDDAGTDGTAQVIAALAQRFPNIRTRILRNETRLGAAGSRNRGAAATTNDYVLFCDDDEYLQPGYAKTCLDKLISHDAAAVSGRRVYMQSGEKPAQTLARYGNGLHNGRPFRYLLCELSNAARFEGDLLLPFTNAIILTRRDLLRRYGFDGNYRRGNGYREESDYQMNLFVHGERIVMTNDTHSIHLPMSETRIGGGRAAGLRAVFWSVYYTNYFFRKYWSAYAARVGLRLPRLAALLNFAGFALYRELLRPLIYPIAIRLLRLRPLRQKARAL